MGEKMKKIFLKAFTFGFFLLSAFQCVSASSITQGEYAIKLAGKLCLGENLSADAAIAALTKVGVMPADGFKPGDPMNWIIAGEILNACRRECKENLFKSLTCCKERASTPDKCCDEVIGLVSSLNEELGLLPPAPPNPPKENTSISS
jgi:hypothetical protein